VSARQLTKSQIATDWVRNHSKAKGLDRSVLLIFAFYVNKETGLTYPTVETVAREIGVHRATAFRRINKLIDLGELEPVLHHRGHRATDYRIVGPDYKSTPANRARKSQACDLPGGSQVAGVRLTEGVASRNLEPASRNLEPAKSQRCDATSTDIYKNLYNNNRGCRCC
jgi:hypothetical protein